MFDVTNLFWWWTMLIMDICFLQTYLDLYYYPFDPLLRHARPGMRPVAFPFLVKCREPGQTLAGTFHRIG